MKYNFQVIGIKYNEITHLLHLTEQEYKVKGIVKLTVDENPGYPCRVSLEDAAIGEEILAFNYEHHAVSSPYKSSGPIFLRINGTEAKLGTNEIPMMLHHRLLSLRVYDDKAMMIDARTVEGKFLEEIIQNIFMNDNASYIQVHNSSPGCYNCQINRVN